MTSVTESRFGDLLTARPPLRRRAVNAFATALMTVAAAVVFVALAFTLYFLVKKGAGIISWHFLTSPIPRNFRVEVAACTPPSWARSS